MLGVANEYATDIVEQDNSYYEKELIDLMTENCKDASKSSKGINRLKVKVINSIDSKLDNLINMNVYKTEEHMNLFLQNAREMIFGYYKSVNLKGFNKSLVDKEDKIKELIKNIFNYSNFLY